MFTFIKSFKLKRLLKKAGIMYQNRLTNPVPDQELKKEIDLYVRVSELYDGLRHSNAYPYAREQAQEALRAAADLGDVSSMRHVGERLIELGKFWKSYEGTLFENKVHNLYATRAFESAYAYLNSGSDRQDPESMRLLGMAYINAWGTEGDIDKGLKLIVKSIDIEDAWARSSEIFTNLGLMNQPEFFTKLMALKGGSTKNPQGPVGETVD